MYYVKEPQWLYECLLSFYLPYTVLWESFGLCVCGGGGGGGGGEVPLCIQKVIGEKWAIYLFKESVRAAMFIPAEQIND